MTKKDLAIYYTTLNKSEEEQRKFKISKESLHRMNEEIIRRHNERVKPGDTVFFIGDLCFKSSGDRGEGIKTKAVEWEDRLNGKLILVRGNHDKNNSCKTIINSIMINLGGKTIKLIHNPEHIQNSDLSITYDLAFVGHVHKNWEIKRIRKMWGFVDAINVGVDVWDFRPVTFNEIMSRYAKWKKSLEE